MLTSNSAGGGTIGWLSSLPGHLHVGMQNCQWRAFMRIPMASLMCAIMAWDRKLWTMCTAQRPPADTTPGCQPATSRCIPVNCGQAFLVCISGAIVSGTHCKTMANTIMIAGQHLAGQLLKSLQYWSMLAADCAMRIAAACLQPRHGRQLAAFASA